MAPFHSKRVTPEKVLVFLMAGFGIGTVVGYIFMATVHTVRLPNPTPPTRLQHDARSRCQPTSRRNAARQRPRRYLPGLRTRLSLAEDAYADAGDPGHVALRRGARHRTRCCKTNIDVHMTCSWLNVTPQVFCDIGRDSCYW